MAEISGIYLCELIGDGTEDNHFRTCMSKHLTPSTVQRWFDIDGRSDSTIINGVMLTVVFGQTPEETISIEADRRITKITPENHDALESHGIPLPKDAEEKTIVNTIAKRFLVRQRLKGEDVIISPELIAIKMDAIQDVF